MVDALIPTRLANDGTSESTSSDQWRVFLGIALLIVSYVFRVEVVRFSLRLAKRAVPGTIVWIKEFEKNLLLPLSWVVFVLLVWFCTYVMNLPDLLRMDPTTIASLIRLFLGVPLIWTVICLCNYVTWGIIRVKGWNKAASKEDDDYNRVMIIAEGIGVIKILLVAYVVSSFMFDGIGRITNFDSSQITTVAVLVVELIFAFGAHSWLKNTMGGLIALIDEQIKSGSHLEFQGHEGTVERLLLQCFCLRRHDKAVVYIPNGLLLEHSVEIKTKAIDRRSTIEIHLDHDTKVSTRRRFIQELDAMLAAYWSDRQDRRKSTVLGLDRKTRERWDFFSTGKKAKLHSNNEEEEHAKPRFWISVTAPFIVQVVYFSQEHNLKPLVTEKTELVLQISELLVKQGICVYRPVGVVAREPSDDDDEPTRSVSPEPRSEPLPPRRVDSPTDSLQKSVSDGNILRQRRPNRVQV